MKPYAPIFIFNRKFSGDFSAFQNGIRKKQQSFNITDFFRIHPFVSICKFFYFFFRNLYINGFLSLFQVGQQISPLPGPLLQLPFLHKISGYIF